jgi:hypothetical protein
MVRAVAIVIGWFIATSTAAADTASELAARGEDLAKDGRFTEAIDAFKAADKLWPTATHKCFVALAYTRLERWPQAEIFMARCHAVQPGETLPEWVAEADALIAQRLADVNVAPVQISVAPGDAKAQLSVSSFAPDETFAPGTSIHLPPGHHVIVATAPGYERAHEPIDIVDRSAKRVKITMHVPPKPPSHVPRDLMIVGGVTAGLGFAAYGVMAYGAWQLDQHHGTNFHTNYESVYLAGRATAIAAWTAGAALAITGYALHRKRRRETPTPTLAIAVVPGGAVVSLGWQR